MLFGLEAIKFQSSPTVFKELVGILRRGTEYRDSLKYENMGKLSEAKFRELKMFEYAKNTLRPALKAFCKKNFNLTLHDVEFLVPHKGPNLTPMIVNFAMYFGMDEANEVATNAATSMGSSSSTYSNKHFNALSELVSLDDGKLTKTSYIGKDGETKPIYAILWFDQSYTYLAMDHVQTQVGLSNPTEEEIAAILLHEIGHMITMMEHLTHTFYKIPRVVGHLEALVNKGSEEDLFKVVIPQTRELINFVKTSTSVKDPIIDGIDKGLVVLEEAGKSDTSAVPGGVFVYIVKLILITIFKILIGILGLVTGTLLLEGLINSTLTDLYTKTTAITGAGRKGKNSDTMNGLKNYYHVERLADEFVSRLGAGGHLAAGLTRLNRFIDFLIIPQPTKAGRRSSYVGLIMKMYVKIFGKMRLILTPPPIIYEDTLDRYKRLVQNNMVVFKNELPPVTLDHYIKDTEQCMKLLLEEKKRTTDTVLLWKKIIEVFPLTSPANFIIKLTSTNITGEVDNLIKSIEAITNTSLNYYGAKFQQLSRTGSESFDRILNEDSWELLDLYVSEQ